MADAVAKAAGVPRGRGAPRADAARRPRRGRGDRAGRRRAGARRGRGSQVGRPLAPMLAATAPDVAAALAKIAPGRRSSGSSTARAIQVHRDGDDVAVFTRTLDDVTARAARGRRGRAARCRRARSCSTARRSRCATTAGRSRSRTPASRFGAARGARGVPLDVAVLRRAAPRRRGPARRAAGRARGGARRASCPRRTAIPRVVADGRRTPRRRAFDAALAAGHEGVMVKALDAPYAAGRRGAAWLKVKPVHTLDLVVLAAEWGHGRRRGLALQPPPRRARRGDGGFVMLGKTFKGLTDELLAWQTEQLLALRDPPRRASSCYVRPELVVEIAFDGVQTLAALPGRRRAALRARQALPRRQARGRGRHGRRPCGRSATASRRPAGRSAAPGRR